MDNHPLLVYPRPGLEEHLAQADMLYHPAVTLVQDAPMMDTSSTGIRVRLRNWKTVDGLVKPEVLAYIRQNGLYTA